MSMLYKTIYYPGNAKAEYQKRGKTWFKRIKGSKGEFYAVDDSGQEILNKEYSGKGAIYFYNSTVLIGGAVAVLGLSYYVYIKMKSFKKAK